MKRAVWVVVPMKEPREEKVNGNAKFENVVLKIKILTSALIAMNFPVI